MTAKNRAIRTAGRVRQDTNLTLSVLRLRTTEGFTVPKVLFGYFLFKEKVARRGFCNTTNIQFIQI